MDFLCFVWRDVFCFVCMRICVSSECVVFSYACEFFFSYAGMFVFVYRRHFVVCSFFVFVCRIVFFFRLYVGYFRRILFFCMQERFLFRMQVLCFSFRIHVVFLRMHGRICFVCNSVFFFVVVVCVYMLDVSCA